MVIFLSAIRPSADIAIDSLLADYIKRTRRYTAIESTSHRSEEEFLRWLSRERASKSTFVTLLDVRGKTLSSESFAAEVDSVRASGRRQAVFAVGPHDGWSPDALSSADLLLSLGPMTLPHQFARLVLAEQVYRAFTILAGHPYHTGH
jgi:23S rRNA (pseudouridine1915-N3)-methyltransferase